MIASTVDCPVPKRLSNRCFVSRRSPTRSGTAARRPRPSRGAGSRRSSSPRSRRAPPRSDPARSRCRSDTRSAPSSIVICGRVVEHRLDVPVVRLVVLALDRVHVGIPLARTAPPRRRPASTAGSTRRARPPPLPPSASRIRLAVSVVTCRQAPIRMSSSGRSFSKRSRIRASTPISPAAHAIRSRPCSREPQVLHIAIHASSTFLSRTIRRSETVHAAPRSPARSSRRPRSTRRAPPRARPPTPAAFVANASPSTRMPSARAATASGTIDIPTTVAPSCRSIRVSAGVSYEGPGERDVHALVDAILRSVPSSALADARAASDEIGIVNLRHVDERRRPVRVPPPGERVLAHEVHVVAQHHEVPGVDRRIERAGRGGEHHRLELRAPTTAAR